MRGKLAAALTLAALVWTAGCIPEYPQYPHELPDTPNVNELKASISNAYNQNPVRFRVRHEGDRVQVRGRVHSIDLDGTVTFNGNWAGRQSSCRFSDLEEVASLDRRDDITFSGIVSVSDGGPVLTGCRVIEKR